MNTTELSAMLPLLLALTAAPALAAGEAPRFAASGCAIPSYPHGMQVDDYQGDVTLAFTLDGHGKVTEAKVVTSSGNARIDRESLRALRNCSFHADAKDSELAGRWSRLHFKWQVD